MTLDVRNNTDQKLKILLDKKACYLTNKEIFYLLGSLLELFGVNFDTKEEKIYLTWGIEDNEHFKEIQRIINQLIRSETIGSYLEKDGIWIIKH